MSKYISLKVRSLFLAGEVIGEDHAGQDSEPLTRSFNLWRRME
jgi:hypothetical protein